MTKPSTRLKISEADLERAATDLLAYDGWRSLKTDPVSRKEWGKGFGERGMADHLYLRYRDQYLQDGTRPVNWRISGSEVFIGPLFYHCLSQVMWIEWKSLEGSPSARQIFWIENERSRGALVLLAGHDFPATYDGFLEWYRASGLMLRNIV